MFGLSPELRTFGPRAQITISNTRISFISWCSTGLGRELALAALNRGDKVIATARARSFEKIKELKEKGADVLELDVTAPLEELKTIAKRAVDIHGRVDVVVNNAGESLRHVWYIRGNRSFSGYLIVGTIEECTFVFFLSISRWFKLNIDYVDLKKRWINSSKLYLQTSARQLMRTDR